MAGVPGAFPRMQRTKRDAPRYAQPPRWPPTTLTNTKAGGQTPGPQSKICPDYLLTAATRAWDEAVQLGEKCGYRNAQATVIAPTGTIGLVMDCDTTGVEPDFALVKFKKLSGGGYFKIINQSVPAALKNLATPTSRSTPLSNMPSDRWFCRSTLINHQTPERKRLYRRRNQETRTRPWARPLRSVSYSMSIRWEKNVCNASGFKPAQYYNFEWSLLEALGFSDAEIEAANRLCLRDHDRRRCATPQRRTSGSLRLRQQVRQKRPALYPCPRPYPDDGRNPAIYQRRDLEDDQSPQRSDSGRDRRCLYA